MELRKTHSRRMEMLLFRHKLGVDYCVTAVKICNRQEVQGIYYQKKWNGNGLKILNNFNNVTRPIIHF